MDDEIIDDEDDLGYCPYYARYEGLTELPTYDPEGICFQLSVCEYSMPSPEPLCVTCVPKGGWPSVHRMLKEIRDGS